MTVTRSPHRPAHAATAEALRRQPASTAAPLAIAANASDDPFGDGSTRRSPRGTRHSDDGAREYPPMLPKPGESLAAYYGRLGAQQAVNVAAGPPGLVGEAVILDHGNGEYSLYAHLKPGSVTVKAGDRVRSGQTVGRLGSSGNSTEPHLHFQVCDAPSAVSCAGIIPTFDGLVIANADGPRPLQSGDIVRAP
jgi:hypothetical protein